jgi:EAL and modified HD-GYP domain-containing signal transduction protein
MLMSDAVELLPRAKVVLEVLETVEMTPPLVERCKALNNAGFTLALDDVVACVAAHAPLLELRPVVKVDLMGVPDIPALEQLTAQLRPWNVNLLTEKVDSEEQFRRCLDLAQLSGLGLWRNPSH